MTTLDGLSGALAQISQIQASFPALAPEPAPAEGGFAAVLQQVASISGGVAGAPGAPAPDLTGSYGWPLEEGKALPASLAGAGATGGQSALLYGSTMAPAIGTASALQAAGVQATGPQATGDQAVAQAEKYLGVPYLWGGTDPAQGLDCSGLVQDVYASLGITLPRTSQQQATAGEAVPSLAQAQPGDLVFYPGSDGTASSPGHVGIYIGNGQMIDAPHAGTGVRIDPVGTPTAIRRVTGQAPSTGGTGGVGNAGGAATYAGLMQPPGGTTGLAPGGEVPSQYQSIFQAASAISGVPGTLLSAVAGTESGFQPGAVSGAGAEGLMQLMPGTAASMGVNPFDPAQAVPAAAQLLASYHQQFGSWSLALAAYNAGPGAVQQYSGVPPYPQTQAYVQGVLSRAGMQGQ
jgi:cell wall-associated NlpC family hydrolase